MSLNAPAGWKIRGKWVFWWLRTALLVGCAILGWVPTEVGAAVIVRWYGHAFIYLISSSGLRIALNPFGEEMVRYKFPPKLQADVVLVSNESDACSAAEKLYGSPQVFRSITAIGVNNARGLIFKGVETYRDDHRGALLGRNVCFVLGLDGIRFIHLGDLGHKLEPTQKEALGRADVLFLPVGNPRLSLETLDDLVKDLHPRIVVPISYKTEWSGALDLRDLESYVKGRSNVKRIGVSEFSVSLEDLPPKTMIYVLSLPTL
jgi:hypothetical protein